MLQNFLSKVDAERAVATLGKLVQHDVSRWALAGGLAVEIHCLRAGRAPLVRQLNDIDFVTESFDSIPETLAQEFLFRHVHPFDPPGKTLLQLIDPNTSLRVDLFRAYGSIMSRTICVNLPAGLIEVISLEDAVARTARLLLDLGAGIPQPAKYVGDYLRLTEMVEPSAVETAWQDHRRPMQPLAFAEVNTLVRQLIATRRDLLVTPKYSTDPTEVCPRCVPHPRFPLAGAKVVLSLLGYC